MKILVVPDKFKGTLTSTEAAEAIARGWNRARAADSIELLPMSDGGDGFGEVMGRLLCAKIQTVKTVDAAHSNCRAKWWWEPKTKMAIIESANVIGLAKLPQGKFHPFELDTFGLGAVIRAAAAKGASRCILGIGGSATNDGGFGLARALGWRFWDAHNERIEQWTELRRLAHIIPPKRRKWFREIIVAVDVRNPLLGKRGATRVYGPQKGLRATDFVAAEDCLKRLATVAKRFGKDWSREPGAGAAGGLGFGLMTFLGANAEPGFELFAQFAHLNERLREVDLVITGEGRLDASSFMGKGAGEITRRCHRLKIPCVALAGEIVEGARAGNAFLAAHALTELTTAEKAKVAPAIWLERLAMQTALHF
jgi:glycerate kinase